MLDYFSLPLLDLQIQNTKDIKVENRSIRYLPTYLSTCTAMPHLSISRHSPQSPNDRRVHFIDASPHHGRRHKSCCYTVVLGCLPFISLNKRMAWKVLQQGPRYLHRSCEGVSTRMRRAFAFSRAEGNSVTAVNSQQFQCVVSLKGANDLQFICDHNTIEPASPSPRQYLMGALASCTAMTLRTFIVNSGKASPSSW